MILKKLYFLGNTAFLFVSAWVVLQVGISRFIWFFIPYLSSVGISVFACVRTDCGGNLFLNFVNLFQIPVSWNFCWIPACFSRIAAEDRCCGKQKWSKSIYMPKKFQVSNKTKRSSENFSDDLFINCKSQPLSSQTRPLFPPCPAAGLFACRRSRVLPAWFSSSRI